MFLLALCCTSGYSSTAHAAQWFMQERLTCAEAMAHPYFTPVRAAAAQAAAQQPQRSPMSAGGAPGEEGSALSSSVVAMSVS
jgi:hypothetical protein